MRLMKKSPQRPTGFTIVELLIVIVVIAILAAIVIAVYTGAQTKAYNAQRYQELKEWQKQFLDYRSVNGSYPAMPVGGYCLGTGFPNGKCRDYQTTGSTTYNESDNAVLMSMLKSTTGSLPNGPHVGVNGTVGFYAIYYGGQDIDIDMVMYGGPSDYPADTIYNWHDGAGRLICAMKLLNQ